MTDRPTEGKTDGKVNCYVSITIDSGSTKTLTFINVTTITRQNILEIEPFMYNLYDSIGCIMQTYDAI